MPVGEQACTGAQERERISRIEDSGHPRDGHCQHDAGDQQVRGRNPCGHYQAQGPEDVLEVREEAIAPKIPCAMTTTGPDPLDFNHLAAHFDRFLPQVHPVTLALLDHLPALPAGTTVLDIACGTGEPGLTLARRSPSVHLQGVDQAEALIAVARGKAALEGLANVRFSVGPMHALAMPDESVDAVVSRFGLLMFGDVPASARELARVLRVAGTFSLAVWDGFSKNTLMSSLLAVLRAHLPSGHRSPMDGLSDWAEAGRRTSLLESLGLGPVYTEMFSWEYRFEHFDEPWAMVRGMEKFTGQADLNAEAQEEVRRELHASLEAYRQPQGQYVIPHACRLIWGGRNPGR